MKKLVSLLLVFVMLLGVLCSCNYTDKDVNIPSDYANTLISEDKLSEEGNSPNDENKPFDEENLPNYDNKPNDVQNKPSNDEEIVTIARENNYHYYKIVGTFELCCDIYDSNGTVVFSERMQRPLNVNQINSDLIEIRIGYGTGIIGSRYFSIKNNKLSDEFFYVVATSETQIAYLSGDIDDRKLIVRDIYQLSDDCKSFDLDFSPVHTPVIDAGFGEDGSTLYVSYEKGESCKMNQIDIKLF